MKLFTNPSQNLAFTKVSNNYNFPFPCLTVKPGTMTKNGRKNDSLLKENDTL
jgi:hypothetical protein